MLRRQEPDIIFSSYFFIFSSSRLWDILIFSSFSSSSSPSDEILFISSLLRATADIQVASSFIAIFFLSFPSSSFSQPEQVVWGNSSVSVCKEHLLMHYWLQAGAGRYVSKEETYLFAYHLHYLHHFSTAEVRITLHSFTIRRWKSATGGDHRFIMHFKRQSETGKMYI